MKINQWKNICVYELEDIILKKNDATMRSCLWFYTSHLKSSTIIMTDLYLYKNILIDQWKRTDYSEINPYIYDQVFLARVSRPFNGGKIVFVANGAGTNVYSYAREWSWLLISNPI